MNSNDTRQCGPPTTTRRDDDRDAGTDHVVLVADSDPALTDDVAGLLRDGYSVRTAYTSDDVRSSLGDDVSVALVDPSLPGLSVDDVVERLADGDRDWRVAALTDGRPADDRFDDHVGKPVSREALRSTVDRLCHCVAYRSALDRYYDVARARATLPPDDPQRERLEERIDDVEVELDEVAESVPSVDAYDAALRDPETGTRD